MHQGACEVTAEHLATGKIHSMDYIRHRDADKARPYNLSRCGLEIAPGLILEQSGQEITCARCRKLDAINER